MPERPDVTMSIELDRVDNLIISDSPIARVVLRNATAAGPVVMNRVSVTEDLDFAQAFFDAPVTFEQVEVLEEVIFTRSHIRGPVVFKTCIFRGDVSFDDSLLEGPLTFEDTTFVAQLRFQGMMVDAPIILRATRHEKPITFQQSSINEPVVINAAFANDLLFDEVNANAPVSVSSTTLGGLVSFRRGAYKETLIVVQTICQATVDLTEISAMAAVKIIDVTFEDSVNLHGGAYYDHVVFKGSVFRGDTAFNNSHFLNTVTFQDLVFQGQVEFREVLFKSPVTFINVIFEGSVSFQKAQFCAGVNFEKVSFRGDVDFDLASVSIYFHKTLFSGQVSLRFGWADVVLEESDFPGPTRLGTSWLDYPIDETLTRALEAAGKHVEDKRPTLRHLTGSNVSNLVLTDLNLKTCRFAGANNLDNLRIEQADPFSPTPNGWRFSRSTPFVATWTSRGAIAEEQAWRINNELGIRREGWLALPSTDDPPEQIPPAESIQRIYRDLRKGREDRKDEPGAADFYYGEMEMRRHATPRRIERVVLDLYWLTSGYALRAWRAVMALLILLVAATIVFMTLGFDRNGATLLRVARVQPNGQVVYMKYAASAPPRDFGAAFTYSIESATSLLRSPQSRPLTGIGEGTEIALRLLGPGLLGLAVLSLRGRVKR